MSRLRSVLRAPCSTASAALIAACLLFARPAAAQEEARISFDAFVEQLQHDTCTALYGDVTQGAGAVCMHHDLLGTYRTDPAAHHADVQLCDAEGGVLRARIPACTEAMVRYLCVSSDYEFDGEVAPLFEAYAAVSSRCWGQWLCQE